MGSTEYADCDFLEMDENGVICVELVMKSYPTVCNKDLCQRAAVTSRLASHSLDGVHRRAWYTRRCGKDRREPGGVKGRHC